MKLDKIVNKNFNKKSFNAIMSMMKFPSVFPYTYNTKFLF